MPRVTFKDKNNNPIETVEVPENTSVMEAARFHSKKEYIEGIEAVCGGGSVCGTCHVHVNENWIDKVTPKDDDDIEQAILDYVENYETSIQEYIKRLNTLGHFLPEMLVPRRKFEGRMRAVWKN